MPFFKPGFHYQYFSKWEGWESIEMVQRYAHLAPRHLSAHARQIDSIFENGINTFGLTFAKQLDAI